MNREPKSEYDIGTGEQNRLDDQESLNGPPLFVVLGRSGGVPNSDTKVEAERYTYHCPSRTLTERKSKMVSAKDKD
jgi:hypothetical protein